MSIALRAIAAYGYAGKQCVARIIGLDPQLTFRRESIGKLSGNKKIATADVDTPGLYSVCDVTNTGTNYETYRIIVGFEDYLLELSAGSDNLDGVAGDDAALQIAKRLDSGEPIQQIVELQIDKKGRPKYRIRAKEGETE